MSSSDNHPRSVFRSLSERNQFIPTPLPTTATRGRVAAPMSKSGFSEREPVMSAPRSPLTTRQLPALPGITRQLPALPNTTRQLPALSETELQRVPLVIKSETRKLPRVPVELPPVEHKKQRAVLRLTGMALLVLVMLLALFTSTPLGQEVGLSFNPLQIGSNLFHNQNTGSYDLLAQATATAVYHQHYDGFDPYFTGGQTLTDGLASRDWPVGQCTYWSNLRYHALTGYWVPWNGNADQWMSGARLAHWSVGQSPHIPSIIVLMPGVQGASGYGHVAVVEGIDGNTVHTSNMNWYSNGGGFDRISNVDFTTGPGVYFVWHM